MIRFQFFSDKYGHVEDGDFKDPDYTMKHWDVHIEHCFEYMRQSISCGGDLILEGSSAVDIDGKQVTSVTGWGKCLSAIGDSQSAHVPLRRSRTRLHRL